MTRRIVFCAAFLAAAACSSAPSTTRFDVQAVPAAHATSAKAAGSASVSTVTLPATLPPASMFLGPSSWRTAPSRWCDQGGCRPLSAPRPPALKGPAGAPVLFAVSAAPKSARLEIAVPGSQTSTVGLSPGTSMVWQAGLPAGTYPMTLVATYATNEVSWPFAIEITAAGG